MLTALSVARDCQMIEKMDKVLLVHVVPPIGDQQPKIEWTYAEDTKGHSVTEVSTPVSSCQMSFANSLKMLHVCLSYRSCYSAIIDHNTLFCAILLSIMTHCSVLFCYHRS